MIQYDDYSHQYWNENKLIYDSPTKMLKFFKEPFDAKNVAIEYAENHGMTPEYWREQWRKAGEKGRNRGHGIHNDREDILQARKMEIKKGKLHRVFNSELIRTEDLYELPDGVYTEMALWNHTFYKAGRADKVTIETIDKVRYVDIDDYKTNKSIDMFSYKREDGTYKTLKKPLSHIMDSSYWHYVLQVGIYAYFLDAFGFTVRNLTLIHIPHPIEFEGFKVQPTDKLYNLPYLKRDVINLLTHYNKYHSYEYKH